VNASLETLIQQGLSCHSSQINQNRTFGRKDRSQIEVPGPLSVWLKGCQTGSQFRCGGPNDFVWAEDSILVDIDDIDGLAGAMRSLIGGVWDTQVMHDGVEARYTKEAVRNMLLGV